MHDILTNGCAVSTNTICTHVTLSMTSNIYNSNSLAFEYILPFPLTICNSLSNTEKTLFISNYSPNCLFQVYRKSRYQKFVILKEQ